MNRFDNEGNQIFESRVPDQDRTLLSPDEMVQQFLSGTTPTEKPKQQTQNKHETK